MISDPLNSALVNATQKLLGRDCDYYAATGTVTTIKAVPEHSLDGVGFESVVTEIIESALLKTADAPHIKRNELLVFGSDSYVVEDIEYPSAEEVRVTLK